jgi:hypothetical protein
MNTRHEKKSSNHSVGQVGGYMKIPPIKQLFQGSSNALKEHPKTACEIKLVFGNLMEKTLLLSGYQSAKLLVKIG